MLGYGIAEGVLMPKHIKMVSGNNPGCDLRDSENSERPIAVQANSRLDSSIVRENRLPKVSPQIHFFRTQSHAEGISMNLLGYCRQGTSIPDTTFIS